MPEKPYRGDSNIEWRRRVFASDDLHLYDSLAVAAAFRPAILTLEPAWVAIETSGSHTSGETVVWLNPVLRKGVAQTSRTHWSDFHWIPATSRPYSNSG